MKICGVDKSKHSRIPFQFPLVTPLFVRSPLHEFFVIINGVYKRSAFHNPLIIIVIVREKSFIEKKKKKRIDEIVRISLQNRSPANLPSFLLVGMHQNVCRLPGSVSFGNLRDGPGGLSFDQ